MSRIASTFARTAAANEAALITYLTAGYPEPGDTVPLVQAAVAAGADVIELGVPFSDPMGDGPVIQESSRVSLAGGTTIDTVLAQVVQLRQTDQSTPIVLMGYLNPFLQYGLERLADAAVTAGVDGFVVPDLPVQHADAFLAATKPGGLDVVFFAAPGSPPERIKASSAGSGGFLYCLATDGVTGVRETLDERLIDFLQRARAASRVPVAVGFGISTPEHVAAVREQADGVIVGSALIRAMAKASGPTGRCDAVAAAVAQLKAETRR